MKKKKTLEPELDQERVLAVLSSVKGRPLHVMEVCGRLGLAPRSRDRVRELLELAAERGLVQELPGLRFRVSAEARPLRREGRGGPSRDLGLREPRRAPSARVGSLRIHARGHGFVSLEDEREEVFVAASALLGALHGDRVAVSVRRGERGLEGVVVAVLRRQLRYVAGPLLETEDGLVIRPNDARLPRLVYIVGRVPGDAVPGLEVVAEVTSFPEDGSPPEAEVVKVLGVEGSAEVEVAKIKLREGIFESFPEDVLEEARAYPPRVTPVERRDREDLRSIPLVTIDPKTARDHDDALFIERIRAGGYRVIVAIADVSHYVKEGTALDREALERCCSIYLPDRAIPMLPPELSSELASLVAGRDRLTLALEIELSSGGSVRSFRYIEGVMRCKAGLTYEGVARALGLTQEGPIERAARRLLPMLEVLEECAMVLRTKRMRRGSLDFDLPEPYVELDLETGEPDDIRRSRKDPGIRRAYQIVEEMMLLANETVAADLASREIPAIYRVHGLPDEDRLEQFATLARALGFPVDPEHLADPKELSRFLLQIEDSPRKGALSYLLLRSMQQASYDTVNIGHFGLAAQHYLHFTSPIRRYPDLAVHRIVRRLARGEPIDRFGTERKLAEQASTASKLERRAMLVEREVMEVYRCILVRDRVGEEFEATITSVAPHGVYCAFDEPFVDALCHVTSLGNDFYELDAHGLRLVGRRSGASYGLGDRLTVRLESVNVAERSILAAPLVHVLAEDEPPRALDRLHEGGYARLARRDRAASRKREQRETQKPRSGSEAPTVASRSSANDRRKTERRRERRVNDERKQSKRRG